MPHAVRLFHYLMKPMKIIHTSMLLPVLLGGCSLPNHRPADSDARQFVDALISTNLQHIELAQKSVKQASAMMQPVRSPQTKTNITTPPATATASAPDTLRGLTRIKSLGTPETFTLVRVKAHNLGLEATLNKVIPAGWTAIISADIQTQSRQRITLEANDQWPYVLDELLHQHGWVALIDWPKKQVSVAYSTPILATKSVNTQIVAKPETAANATNPSSPTAIVATGSRNPFNGTRDKSTPAQPKNVAVPVVKAVPTPKVWRIEAGSTLKDTLFSWAAAEKCSTPGVANWTVAWLTSANYRIDAPLQFDGSFRDALNSLFTLYGTAQVPLYAGVRQAQCVISVDDKEIH